MERGTQGEKNPHIGKRGAEWEYFIGTVSNKRANQSRRRTVQVVQRHDRHPMHWGHTPTQLRMYPGQNKGGPGGMMKKGSKPTSKEMGRTVIGEEGNGKKPALVKHGKTGKNQKGGPKQVRVLGRKKRGWNKKGSVDIGGKIRAREKLGR